MNRSKAKHFWSQILAGMIAIFLLPTTQSLESHSVPETAYQNTQTLQTPTAFEQVLSFQQQQSQTQCAVTTCEQQKLLQNPPRFWAEVSNPLAPIRAGPVFS